MATGTAEVGSIPLNIGQYNVSINSVTAITLPTTAQLKPKTGILELVLSLETVNARITFDGTNPSATNGILLAAPGTLNIRGQAMIAALKIIGVASGGVINYGFSCDDMS